MTDFKEPADQNDGPEFGGKRPGNHERPEHRDHPGRGQRPGPRGGRQPGFRPPFVPGPTGGFGLWGESSPFNPGGFGPRGGGPRRTPRGFVGLGILSLLSDNALNGYALMQTFADKSNGTFTPKSGAIYPALNKLVEAGLVEVDETGDYSLTDRGRKIVEHQREHINKLFGFNQEPIEIPAIHEAYRKLNEAFGQLMNSGTEEQQERITEKLDQLRRDIYRVLSE